MSDSTIYTHFRCDNGDGSSKDWAIAIVGDGLRIRYCATGQTARLRTVSSQKFPGKTAQEEMRHRIEKKLDGGYQELGEARLERGRLVESKPVTETFLHWEAQTAFPEQELTGKLAEFHDEVATLDLGVEIVVFEWGIRVRAAQREWNFGFHQSGGLQADGRGGGQVSAFMGPVPVLILLAVDRAYPGTLRFSDEHGNQVRPLIDRDDEYLGVRASGSFDRVTQVGAALGLCLGPLRLGDTLGDDAQGRSLWF